MFTNCEKDLLLSLKLPLYYTGMCIHVIDKKYEVFHHTDM